MVELTYVSNGAAYFSCHGAPAAHRMFDTGASIMSWTYSLEPSR